jgi:D-amino peptidase
MKIYISADIEGVAGITHRDESDASHPSHAEFRERMTGEVVAACEGAIVAGATDILIKDAHGNARNILAERLPACTRLIRGWSGHPLMMIEELDKSFDAVLFIGYHSKSGSDGNPLAHTLSSFAKVELNDEVVSEFTIFALAAAWIGVPVVFLSGDRQLCGEVALQNPKIQTVAVTEAIGPSTLSIAPGYARDRIRAGVARSLKGDLSECRIPLRDRFKLGITWGTPVGAYRISWYPGMQRTGPLSLSYETTDYFEILRALRFAVWG